MSGVCVCACVPDVEVETGGRFGHLIVSQCDRNCKGDEVSTALKSLHFALVYFIHCLVISMSLTRSM